MHHLEGNETSDHIEPQRFFDHSSQSGKSWNYRHLGGGKFQITKLGAKCEVCSLKFGEDRYKSVRVQYATFVDKQGRKKEEFEWVNVKCTCLVCIIYKNGRVSITPAAWYADKVKVFDDLKNIPSSVSLRIND